jgi:hypothetical protein
MSFNGWRGAPGGPVVGLGVDRPARAPNSALLHWKLISPSCVGERVASDNQQSFQRRTAVQCGRWSTGRLPHWLMVCSKCT